MAATARSKRLASSSASPASGFARSRLSRYASCATRTWARSCAGTSTSTPARAGNEDRGPRPSGPRSSIFFLLYYGPLADHRRRTARKERFHGREVERGGGRGPAWHAKRLGAPGRSDPQDL